MQNRFFDLSKAIALMMAANLNIIDLDSSDKAAIAEALEHTLKV